MGNFGSYLVICRALTEGRLSADEFETVFLSVFRGEGDAFAEQETRALHLLFSAVDSYCGDAQLRDEGDLDEYGLAAAAETFLNAIGNNAEA